MPVRILRNPKPYKKANSNTKRMGQRLQAEHERYLGGEDHSRSSCATTLLSIKAFYMRLNDEKPEIPYCTVAAMTSSSPASAKRSAAPARSRHEVLSSACKTWASLKRKRRYLSCANLAAAPTPASTSFERMVQFITGYGQHPRCDYFSRRATRILILRLKVSWAGPEQLTTSTRQYVEPSHGFTFEARGAFWPHPP